MRENELAASKAETGRSRGMGRDRTDARGRQTDRQQTRRDLSNSSMDFSRGLFARFLIFFGRLTKIVFDPHANLFAERVVRLLVIRRWEALKRGRLRWRNGHKQL